jgi:hypothetical protein
MNPLGDTGLVNIEDRAVILSGGTNITVATADVRMGIELGTHEINVSFAGPPLDHAGEDFSNTLSADGVGSIDVTAIGNFRTGDIVFIDLDDDRTVDAGESFTVTGGFATFSLTSISAALDESFTVWYVPNGVDELQPETIAVVAATNYVVGTNAVESTGDFRSSAGFIKYIGVDQEGYAYGVVRQNGTDVSFVRVTCEASSGCNTFFSCTDDTGVNSFGDGGFVPGNATEPFSSNDIGMLLGNVTFTGRGACDIFSDAKISVQHKIRSSDILTDNSVVIGQCINGSTAVSDCGD